MAIRRRARSEEASEREQILPEAEMEVLARLHTLGETDAAEIRRALEPFRPMSHASVLTLLGRLEAKGLVRRRKGGSGKAFLYTATRSAGPLHRKLLKRILQRIFADDSASLVASLFESRSPSADELRQIRELVEAMETKGSR